MILDPTDFLIYDLRLSDFYLSTNAFLNRKSQFINYKLIDSFIFNFQLSIFNSFDVINRNSQALLHGYS